MRQRPLTAHSDAFAANVDSNPAHRQRLNTNVIYAMNATRRSNYSVELMAEIPQTYDRLAELVGGRSALIVTTPTVAEIYGQTLSHALPQSPVRVLDVNEPSKNLSAVETVSRWAQEAGIERDGCLYRSEAESCQTLSVRRHRSFDEEFAMCESLPVSLGRSMPALALRARSISEIAKATWAPLHLPTLCLCALVTCERLTNVPSDVGWQRSQRWLLLATLCCSKSYVKTERH